MKFSDPIFLRNSRHGLDVIVTNAACWTYADLAVAAGAVARSLETHSAFGPGERVILLLPNSAEYVAGFYGVLLAGGVVVPVPPKTEDELAAIFFTGGSTGSPKGVMVSHRNLISNARSIQQYLRITTAERPLCVLPFHHAFGNSVWQSHLLGGATVVLDGQTSFPETIVTALARHECTSLSGVPDLFRILLERTSLGETALPKLRYMAVAGGALQHELALEVARRVAPAELFVMYGQTEATARLTYLPPEFLDKLPAGTIGRAVPEVILEVVDEQDRPVARGIVGELRARGPNMMLGYWRNPAATAERIRAGWLYTGDLAAQGDDGWISLHGRRSSFVKIAGFRVDPEHLEDFAVRRLAASQAVIVHRQHAVESDRFRP